jgi:hypothetical protein
VIDPAPRYPKRNELYYIRFTDQTRLAEVMEVGPAYTVVLRVHEPFGLNTYHTLRWSDIKDPVKATPNWFERLLGYR